MTRRGREWKDVLSLLVSEALAVDEVCVFVQLLCCLFIWLQAHIILSVSSWQNIEWGWSQLHLSRIKKRRKEKEEGSAAQFVPLH